MRELNKPEVRYAQLSTAYGETKNVVLSDGTEIMLNACSSLRYPEQFAGEERRVELTGEAYIHAARNEAKPFIVTTSRMDVKVLGTSFDVKSYPEDEIVSVKVESGLVQVDLPDAMMRLKKTERFYLNTTSGKIERLKEVTEKVAEWRSGILSFNSTPLYDVARELERRYQCKISFANGETFDNLISGEHENASLEDVLKSIEFVSCVKYIYKKETGEVLFSKK